MPQDNPEFLILDRATGWWLPLGDGTPMSPEERSLWDQARRTGVLPPELLDTPDSDEG